MQYAGSSLVVQPVKEVGREVADDDIGPGTQDAFGDLEGHGLEIEDTGLGAGVHHGVLAADMVCGDGEVAAELLGVADDVEVLGGGLDHDDVGALADVPRDGAAREPAAAGRELVALAVAKRGRRHGGVAEGTVQAARELGGVRHQQRLVRDPLLDQLQLDGADAAVVHVGRRDAVRARLRVRQGHVADAVHRELVVERAVVPQDPAVPVRSVLAEAHVDGDEELREALAQESDCLHDGALGVVGCGAESIFGTGLQGHAE